MTTNKIIEAFAECVALLPRAAPVRFGNWDQHLVFMCIEGSSYAGSKREKSMRWLGFVQGALWAKGISSIEDLKNMNRPDE